MKKLTTKQWVKKLNIKKAKKKPVKIKTKKTKLKTKNQVLRFEVTSERSGNLYIVSKTETGPWRCNCMGHMRHGFCRHVAEIILKQATKGAKK